jgi:hypothetical protein
MRPDTNRGIGARLQDGHLAIYVDGVGDFRGRDSRDVRIWFDWAFRWGLEQTGVDGYFWDKRPVAPFSGK